MCGQYHAPSYLPPGKRSTAQEADGRQGWSGQVREISLPPGFDLRPVQHVVSRYRDYAITAHTLSCSSLQ
jgi:hypothetical protein